MGTAVSIYEVAIITLIGDDSAITTFVYTETILKSVAHKTLTLFGGIVVVEFARDVAADTLEWVADWNGRETSLAINAVDTNQLSCSANALTFGFTVYKHIWVAFQACSSRV